ncbi:MAG TPA: hypothetical protein VKK31_19040 [Thermoanaerobaculia bacterium]|nr:hypothetical protein [Thermoanaerobaculia bacterium]
MATKGSTIPERIARWKVIAAGLRPLLAEMPHLIPLHTELERIIQESETQDARNEALKAATRELTSTRESLAKSGDDLRLRLGASLQTTYGFKSERLIEFGIPPRRPRGRAKKAKGRQPVPHPRRPRPSRRRRP